MSVQHRGRRRVRRALQPNPVADPSRASAGGLGRGRQRVPDLAIYVAAKRLEVPTYAEGFDYLYRVRIVGPSDSEIIALPP